MLSSMKEILSKGFLPDILHISSVREDIKFQSTPRFDTWSIERVYLIPVAPN